MSFLKKLGQLILKGAEVWLGFAPLAQLALPGEAGGIQVVSRDLKEIADIIVTVEAAGAALGLPGVDKLKMAGPLVAQAIGQSALLVGRPVALPALYAQGAQKIADGMADVINSLKGDVPTISLT